jgi:predicted ATP-dependent endonuclease of OLD family
MRIEKVRVEGFRLLKDAEILLEPTATVIVGRNNSGKTSLTEVFDRFAGDGGVKFRLEDFAAALRPKFSEAKKKHDAKEDPSAVLATLPIIAVTLSVRYDVAEEFGSLASFVIDLDPAATLAIVRVEYKASLSSLDGLFDIPAAEPGVDINAHFFRQLRRTLPRAYNAHLYAIDPTDETNRREFDSLTPLLAALKCGFIGAQRTLDLARSADTDVIGKLLGELYKTATSKTAAEADQLLANQLKLSVDGIEKGIQVDFDSMVKDLMPALAVFGFPSMNDTTLQPETSLNVESLLSDHTKIFYAGADGVHLPEGYNGLGTRNLIYMLLKLETFHKAYRAEPSRPGVHLVFIEEPEAHLHPQMQEVFISQLNEAVKALSAKYVGDAEWQVQFVVSTHSSHVANAATFEAIRYFLSSPPDANGIRHTKVKDFRKGLDTIDPDDRQFLHQYMTLTKCDLYFADKAILVEGTTERVLMPRICKLVDETLPEENKLARQYVTTIEVGGAYADKFYPLLDFLELKSLVVGDLDAVYLDDTVKPRKWKKCPVADGVRTSSQALKAWFGIGAGDHLTLTDLAAKTDEDKIKGFRRIAYQISEEGSTECARSYEDALVLANAADFGVTGADQARQAWAIAEDMPKADTAIEFAIKADAWTVPRYIREGLVWLSQPPPPPAEPPPLAVAAEPAPAPPPAVPEEKEAV